MTDPVSLIALGAAVGGSAGKVTERAWDSAETWLRERFGSHSVSAQQRARLNAADFVKRLADSLALLEHSHEVDRERIEKTSTHPQFTALLQRTVINSAQTDESSKHTLLAKLISARLLSDCETTLSLASSMASDAISLSTARQLRLIALSSFVFEVRPRVIRDEQHYREWLTLSLEPFCGLEFEDIDARHLVAISCATYDPQSERDLALWLKFKWGPGHLTLELDDLPVIDELQSMWDSGLAGLLLTSVGSLVGALAFDQITGGYSGLPQWD